MSSNNDYYKNLWTDPYNHGGKFWKNVDFSAPQYQFQEKVFRDYIRKLDNIKSVLELGVGTGRMTKIVREELVDIDHYVGIDIRDPVKWIGGEPYPYFIRGNIIDILDEVKDPEPIYDLILASEVFMHIKPVDIENVIGKLSKIGKQIINIDWAFEPDVLSEWCFMHRYDVLFPKYGGTLRYFESMKEIKQALWHYKFGD